MNPLVELNGVGKSFGAVEALKDVSLQLAGGEVVALVGDNGAGKSTLVGCLSGIHTIDVGQIRVDGHAVSLRSPSEAQRHGIETVHQNLALCDNLDVVANLFLGRELSRHGVLDELSMETRAHRLLTQLSINIPNLRLPVGTLSGGQRQCVAVARAMLFQPRVVLLDEPTAALGVAQAALVLELITRLKTEGVGVILISHNLADVMRVSTRVVVLRLGRTVAFHETALVDAARIVADITGVGQAAA